MTVHQSQDTCSCVDLIHKITSVLWFVVRVIRIFSFALQNYWKTMWYEILCGHLYVHGLFFCSDCPCLVELYILCWWTVGLIFLPGVASPVFYISVLLVGPLLSLAILSFPLHFYSLAPCFELDYCRDSLLTSRYLQLTYVHVPLVFCLKTFQSKYCVWFGSLFSCYKWLGLSTFFLLRIFNLLVGSLKLGFHVFCLPFESSLLNK